MIAYTLLCWFLDDATRRIKSLWKSYDIVSNFRRCLKIGIQYSRPDMQVFNHRACDPRVDPNLVIFSSSCWNCQSQPLFICAQTAKNHRHVWRLVMNFTYAHRFYNHTLKVCFPWSIIPWKYTSMIIRIALYVTSRTMVLLSGWHFSLTTRMWLLCTQWRLPRDG